MAIPVLAARIEAKVFLNDKEGMKVARFEAGVLDPLNVVGLTVMTMETVTLDISCLLRFVDKVDDDDDDDEKKRTEEDEKVNEGVSVTSFKTIVLVGNDNAPAKAARRPYNIVELPRTACADVKPDSVS